MKPVIASDRQTSTPDDFGPGWYVIASSRELKRDQPLALTRFGHKLVAFRSGNEVGVLFDRCPHHGIKLSNGHLHEGQLVCPFHGFRFDVSGTCTHIPVQPADAVIPKSLGRLVKSPIVEVECSVNGHRLRMTRRAQWQRSDK